MRRGPHQQQRGVKCTRRRRTSSQNGVEATISLLHLFTWQTLLSKATYLLMFRRLKRWLSTLGEPWTEAGLNRTAGIRFFTLVDQQFILVQWHYPHKYPDFIKSHPTPSYNVNMSSVKDGVLKFKNTSNLQHSNRSESNCPLMCIFHLIPICISCQSVLFNKHH